MRIRNVTDNVRVSNAFLIEIMIVSKAIKFYFKVSYDKQNLILVVISYEMYDTRCRLISYEMTTRLRSSISLITYISCQIKEVAHQQITNTVQNE